MFKILETAKIKMLKFQGILNYAEIFSYDRVQSIQTGATTLD